MKKLLYILIPIILLSGCVTKKACDAKFPCLTDTSTTTKTEVRDSIVFIEPDQSILQALIYCDSTNQLLFDSITILKGKKSNIIYEIRDNPNGKGKILTVDCKCDSMAIYLKLKDRLQIKTTNKTQIVPDPVTSFDRYLTKIIWILGILAFIVLIYLAYRLFKK